MWLSFCERNVCLEAYRAESTLRLEKPLRLCNSGTERPWERLDVESIGNVKCPQDWRA